MHKYIILFFSVLLFCAACKEDKPAGILDRPHMISLLTDIHLADGELYIVPQQADSLYRYGTNKYKQVFDKHHTNGAQFKRSFAYYSKNPEVLQGMYDELMAIMQRKTDSLNKTGDSKIKNAVPVQ
ncbi:DUF4296 domain-containing protein [Mucilaginibacter pallidiroseus]|uniref:DUF4296 domain-containing protein n=1 Tax=Mucilaginibacter pallidiroseus TaxID=2599295 RepID=A0A563UIX5_9SPHI|nr:DUF4296 domain-containing protein [Mucilaginibacter pallidiroseus]TWR31291.1 DUF4296 domain-containing protein [Mucilaginibacter pallidiroseus]